MDLVTLIMACALNVEPKVMHALIFEQSGGEPWSFSEAGQGYARALPTIQDAIREARAMRPEAGRIRVGLAGLPTDPRAVTAVIFASCPNITMAARQIAQLMARCKNASNSDPTYCAIAVYHGSWDRPDTTFANAVRATMEKGNAPNFEMPSSRSANIRSACCHHCVSFHPARSRARMVQCALSFKNGTGQRCSIDQAGDQ